MKKIFFSLSLLFSLSCVAQLQTGVYARQHLASVSRQGGPQGNCYNWQVAFSSNLFPYATGMDIYLKFDSIPGAPNSVQIWSSPTYINVPVNTGDSILIQQGMNDIYVYYLAATTVYLSLEAVGTPQISGEPYFCYHSIEWAVFADGCSSVYNEFAGGGGPLDNNKGCTVDGPLSTNSVSNSAEILHPFPNPSNGKFSLTEKGFVIISDAQGRMVFSFRHEENEVVDLSDLEGGIYFLRIENESGIKTTKLELIRE